MQLLARILSWTPRPFLLRRVPEVRDPTKKQPPPYMVWGVQSVLMMLLPQQVSGAIYCSLREIPILLLCNNYPVAENGSNRLQLQLLGWQEPR